jgi:L-fuconolactonase
MFGSDWPVCLLAASYERVIEAARFSMSELNRAEVEGVFGANTVRVYGLAV